MSSRKSSNPITDTLNIVVPRKYQKYTPTVYKVIVLVLVWAFIGLILGDIL